MNSPTFTNVVSLAFANVVSVVCCIHVPVDVRPTLEDLQLRAANGVFETKEHFAAVALGLLPAYWLAWRAPLLPSRAVTRKYLTWMLAFVVWWSFVVGELLNNIKGMFP